MAPGRKVVTLDPVTTAGQGLLGNRYAVERVLGRGGVGEVVLAHDQQLGRWVAIKRLHPETARAAELAEAAVAEATRLASLQHPNIVTIHDYFSIGADIFVVMEFVNGLTFEDLSDPLPLDDFLSIARQSLEGLAAAHAMGMIHRDIKPSNLMLCRLPTGSLQVKILDFGLAKVASTPSPQTLDHTGSLLGSIHFISPEQLEQLPLDARADLYALGCVFYRALTTRDPFDGESVAAVISAHLHHRFEPLVALRPDLPESVVRWTERLFARSPDERPESAATAKEELSPPRERRSTARKKLPWAWLAALGALAVAGTGLWLGLPKPTGSAPSAHASAQGALAPTDRDALASMIGKDVVIEGTLARLGENKSKTIYFLNFENASRGDLALVFFAGSANPDFRPDILRKFLGRKVQVAGKVSEYRDAPQLVIDDLQQITLID